MGEVVPATHQMPPPCRREFIRSEIIARTPRTARVITELFSQGGGSGRSLRSPHTIILYDCRRGPDGTFFW